MKIWVSPVDKEPQPGKVLAKEESGEQEVGVTMQATAGDRFQNQQVELLPVLLGFLYRML